MFIYTLLTALAAQATAPAGAPPSGVPARCADPVDLLVMIDQLCASDFLP
jgi:hypothetical protein